MAATLDVALNIDESDDRIQATFRYAADLFDRSTIERMAAHWLTLLGAFVTDPDRRLSELPLLSDAERRHLLVGLNDTALDYPRDALMQGLFETQVARAPERTAVRAGAHALTYAQLDARANRIAHELRARGVGRGRRVGLCVERDADMLAAVLGVLKAGAAYVPLDPSFPDERLRFMAEDAQLALLVSTLALARPFGFPRERQLLLDGDAGALASHSGERLASDAGLDANPEDPAYVIYTSGSTGWPKGVVVPHRSVVNFLASMARAPGLAADDVLVAVTTLSFDIAVLELQLPLAVGATVAIASRDEALDGRVLARMLEQHGATVMQATPATWRLLVEAGWTGRSRFKVLVGGEALPRDLADQLLARGVELWNMYGPTETTVWSSCARIVDTSGGISIGRPIANTAVYILDGQGRLCPIGVPGELCIAGAGVTLGYWQRPELTAERFVPDPFSGRPDAVLYRTGDRARWRHDGILEYLGRQDFQVKVRGYRIELGEIEAALDRIDGITQAVVVVSEDHPAEPRIVAYYTGRDGLAVGALRRSLAATLPEYMLPSIFQRVEAFPLAPNGKLDRKALPVPQRKRPQLAQEFVAPRKVTEKLLAAVWCELLQLDEVGIDDPFFELGGNSLAAVRMVNLFRTRHGREIPLVKVFQYPTIAQLCRFLDDEASGSSFLMDSVRRAAHSRREGRTGDGTRRAVAIIGMVGRFPGADDLEQLWRNLCNSVESISFFSPDELGPGIEPHLRDDPDYIRARGLIDGADRFDAAFFGISPLEATVMDPQQRVFLELAHQALETAGYDPDRYQGLIGVYAGIGDNHYYTTNLLTHPNLMAMAGKLAVEYGNQKDYIALRTAYLLNLRGPAVSSNTACSTALLAVDQAYRALLDHECDMALAGGVDITVPQKSGFIYQEGGTFAKDGHCRPFDADATGTMFCDGAGIVVLKRLDDALADGDTIRAVLIGSGKNNNGSRPASFLAPSVEGQAEAIALAQARADVPVETIRYIEAHGTGTPVGDPIELEALAKVYKSKTDKKHFCYVGSIKGNIGHPTNAAGVAGLIKTVLVLEREQIPATLHFRKLNPKIDLTNSAFAIADRLIPLPRGSEPRRAAVSSFGFGGTNVHTILEEAPLARPGGASRPMQLLPLSARTASSLDAFAKLLADHMEDVAPERFADTAYTLQTGRKQMAQRRFVVAADPGESARLLRKPNPLRCGSKRCDRRDPAVVFMFGGQGTQYVNMGHNLYQGEPLFRAIVDDCCDILKPHLGRDLRELLYPRADDEQAARTSLQDTFYTQPSIFVIEYALARLWQSFGVQPEIMVGHSIGEFVAATLAGVWDLEDALRIIALRGRLMQDLPRGAMLAVNGSAQAVEGMLSTSVQIAAVNSPSLCVVAGPEADVEVLKESLEGQEIVCRPLHTSHAFHSAMMDPIVDPLRAAVAKVRLRAPALPFVSTVKGAPITEAETTDPGYWAHHARATVQFSNAVTWLLERQHDLFLECGPRATLSSLVRQHVPVGRAVSAIPTLSDTHEGNAEWAAMLFGLGSLWQNGVPIDWDAFYAHEDRRKVPLPTYAFDRQRYWVDPASPAVANAGAPVVRPVEAVPVVQPAGAGVESAGACASSRQPATSTVRAGSRKSRIASRLTELLAPLSGTDASQISHSDTFIEQGFNSLSLTQVAIAISNAFGVKMTFRQLISELPTVEMVAASLDEQLPADAYADGPTAQAPTVAGPAAARGAAEATEDASAVAPRATVVATTGIGTPPSRTAQPPLETVLLDQANTIARLSSVLDRLGLVPRAAAAVAPPGTAGALNDVLAVALPLTAGQREIWVAASRGANASRVYNQVMVVRLGGALDIGALRASIQRLVDLHDALRTTFSAEGDRQFIHPRRVQDLSFVDLSGLAEQERARRVGEITDQCSRTVFDLVAGPLMKAHLARLSEGEHLLHLAFHHIVMDGWAAHVVALELGRLYTALAAGSDAEAPPSMQYRQYVDWYHGSEAVAARRDDERFWLGLFSDLPPSVELPAKGRPKLAERSYRAGFAGALVEGALYRRIKKISAESNATLFHFLLASVGAWLHRATGQQDVVVGVPIAGQLAANLQHMAGCDRLIGHTTNVLPIRAAISDGRRFIDLLHDVKSSFLEAREHQGFGCGELIQKLDPPRDAGHLPLVSVTLNLNDEPEIRMGGLTAHLEVPPRAYLGFDLEIDISEGSDGLRVACHFADELFDGEVAKGWLAEWKALISSAAESPETSLDRLQVKVDGGASRSAGDSGTTGGDCFVGVPAQQIAAAELATPAAVEASARTLNNRKTRIANRLSELLAPLSGLEAAQISHSDTFIEQGFNSLSLTQVAIAIRTAFGVRMTFRQLISELPTVEMVAARLDEQLPAEAFPEDPAVHPPVVAAPAAKVAIQSVPGAARTVRTGLPAEARVAPPALESLLAEQARTIARLSRLLEHVDGGAVQGSGSARETAKLVQPARNSFYFGPRDRQLFASWHPPTNGDGRVLTVVCQPLLSEYSRTWLALRNLADKLAEQGQHVLRFDYRGTGDSCGDFDAITISDWIEDIGTAVAEGKRRSNIGVVQLVGVRAGGLLACAFAAKRSDVHRIVLWDPVPDGPTYLESVHRIQTDRVRRNTRLSRADRMAAMQEVRGFRPSGAMLSELRSLDGGLYTAVGASRLHVVSTAPEHGLPVDTLTFDVVRFGCRWDTESEDVLIPASVLERLRECLTLQ